MRVLLVEDSPDDRFWLSRMLRSSDDSLDVFEAGTAEGALDMIKDQPFDLVISDFNLPGRSGVDLVAELRERKIPTPVLIITGSGNVAAAQGSFDAGAVAFLAKENLDADALRAGIDRTQSVDYREIDLTLVPIDLLNAGTRISDRLLQPIESLEQDMRAIRERRNRAGVDQAQEMAALDSIESQIMALHQAMRDQISQFKRQLV